MVWVWNFWRNNILILFGAQAVGKMTLGQSLANLTNFKLVAKMIKEELNL